MGLAHGGVEFLKGSRTRIEKLTNFLRKKSYCGKIYIASNVGSQIDDPSEVQEKIRVTLCLLPRVANTSRRDQQKRLHFSQTSVGYCL